MPEQPVNVSAVIPKMNSVVRIRMAPPVLQPDPRSEVPSP
ncbi:hypothetical protein PLANTIT3_61230 [Plantibacter sp. T3]|nr:hypothetical protein PLANTIT3_61230 [Plantibacter sp. T3]